MTDYIPYSRQCIDESDIQAVVEVLRSSYITTGPAVDAFEKALAEYTGARYAITFSSGTAALHAAYAAAGLGPGDEIVTSPITYAATGNAALLLGARPVFADVDATTGNLDPASAERAVTERTKLLVPVDYAGHPGDLDAYRALATRHGLKLVQDACHSLGAVYRGAPVGTQADMTTLSFHPVKSITTAEGGAVLTDDPSLRDYLRLFRSHGVEKDATRFESEAHGRWSQEMQLLGPNYRLTDLQCALGSSQLRRIDGFMESRRAIAARYTGALAGTPGLSLPATDEAVLPSWHLYAVRFHVADLAQKAAVFEALQDRGVGAQVHYVPVYLHPHYKRLGYQKGSCPAAERFYREVISVPLYPYMEEPETERVIAAVRAAAALVA